MKNKTLSKGPTYERKGFSTALSCFLEEACPSLRGELIRNSVVKEICSLVDKYYPPTEHMRMGQMLWYAIALDERGCGKRLEQCRLQPVTLDVIHETDIQDIMEGAGRKARNTKIAVRLFKQAYDQGGVMSCADVGAIMRLSGGTIAQYIREYQRTTGTMVPTRGSIHDIGPTLTHKKLICHKHLFEGKSIQQTAKETNHAPTSVTRYINDFKRVRECLKAGWDVQKTAYTTAMAPRVTEQYFQMMEQADELPF